ncbi:MAG: paraquat-inducible protein A [Gammaproteobacteria bacterium]|nr:paraquat-inducible protein A [Gammaproteobacteria bacterium]
MLAEQKIDPKLVACPECDLLNHLPDLSVGESANCVRCEAVLAKNVENAIDRSMALTWTAVILFAIANLFPFLSFGKGSIVTHTKLISGVMGFYQEGMYFLSAVVGFTTLVVPITLITGLVYLLLPLQSGLRMPGAEHVFRWMLHIRQWNMTEIFVIGIVVAGIKLYKMATLEPGISAVALLLLMFVFTLISASLDARMIFEKLADAREVKL